MEQLQESRERALKKVRVANHMLTQTFPMVNDPKMLLAVLENLFSSLSAGMEALLHFEYRAKHIDAVPQDFDAMYNLFKLQVVDKYRIKREYVTFMAQIKDILAQHKSSPVEFTRKDVFVICSDEYKMHTLSVEDLKRFVATARSFVQDVLAITR